MCHKHTPLHFQSLCTHSRRQAGMTLQPLICRSEKNSETSLVDHRVRAGHSHTAVLLCPCCGSLWTSSSWSRWQFRFVSPRKSTALFWQQSCYLRIMQIEPTGALVGSVGLLQRGSRHTDMFPCCCWSSQNCVSNRQRRNFTHRLYRRELEASGQRGHAINGRFPFGWSGDYSLGKLTTLRIGRQRNRGSLLDRKFQAKDLISSEHGGLLFGDKALSECSSPIISL
jgi:hypothetical protein